MTVDVNRFDDNIDDVTCRVNVTARDVRDLVELRRSLRRRIDVSAAAATSRPAGFAREITLLESEVFLLMC